MSSMEIRIPQEQEVSLDLEQQLYTTIQLFQLLLSVLSVKVHFQPLEEQRNLERLMLRTLLSLNSEMVLLNPSLKVIMTLKDRQRFLEKQQISNLPVDIVDLHMSVLQVILMILAPEHTMDLDLSSVSIVQLLLEQLIIMKLLSGHREKLFLQISSEFLETTQAASRELHNQLQQSL